MNPPRLFKMGVGGIPVILCAAALCVSAPLHAQINQTISVTCTSSGQLCTPSYSTVISVPQPGTMILNYTTLTNQCAIWRVHFYVDGLPFGISGFLQAPALSTGPISVNNVAAGNHTIELQAEGQTGGCDSGTLSAWGGTLSIQLPSPQTAPPPLISSLSPSAAAPGGPTFTLTVNGSGFVGGSVFANGSVVQWNGSPLSTTFLAGGTQLTALVPASLIANPGIASITVLNPNGMVSNGSTFTFVRVPTPTITSVVNGASYGTQICPGAEAIIYGVNLGTNFAPPPAGTSVTVGGKAGFVAGSAPTQLLVQIPFEAPTGATNVIVAFNGITSAPFNITLATYCPALFTFGPNGTGNVNVFPATPSPGTPGTPGTPARAGDTLNIFATGLGPTNPATVTGVGSAMNPTATPVSMTIGGTPVPAGNILYAGVGGGPPGFDLIQLKVPSGVQGTQPITISIGGVSSPNPVTLPLAGITSLVSSASFSSAGTAAPGSIVTIFANGLGSTDQTTGFPSSNFQGVQVTFNGTAAPLFHLIASATPQQIDLLVPEEMPTSGTVNVQLSTPTGVNPIYTLNMAPAVPGLYRLQDPSDQTRYNVIAQFANTAWLALPVSMTAALKFPPCSPSINLLSLCGQPATIGDYLVFYVTGLGKATVNGDPNGAPLATGVIPPTNGSVLYETPTKPTVTIGGVPTPVQYSGVVAGFQGEYAVIVQVPSGVANGDDIPVTISMAGLSDTATISIQPRYVASGP